MDNQIKGKIKIGISACQYGCKVRYNAKGWDTLDNLKREKFDFQWFPVCPEVMSGQGVPRTAISLRGGNGDDFWQGKANIKSRDNQTLDRQMKKSCEFCLDMLKKSEVDVYIFMEGSPTCGVYRTTLKNKRLGKPPGIFGSLLLKEKIFLIPSVDLQSPIKWWDWRRRMYAYIWLKEIDFSEMDIKKMYEIWHLLKLLCQELNRKKSDIIGKTLAEHKKGAYFDFESIKDEILNLLREPSSMEKIKNNLWKNYSFLRKKKELFIDEIMEPTDIRNMTHIANELLKIEIESRKNDLLFGASPILKGR